MHQKQLTQSSLSRFKQVRAHCTPTTPALAVEQLKYSFGEGQAVETVGKKVQIPLIYYILSLKKTLIEEEKN